jgi:hypothetical protein
MKTLKKINSDTALASIIITFLVITQMSCIQDKDYEEREIGKPGTMKYVYHWHSSYIFDENTGITDTIFPTSPSDQVTIEKYERFRVFVGSQLALDLEVIGGGSIDSYRDERLCDQTIGGAFMLLSGDHKVYYKFEGGGYYQFWQVPFLDGTTYDSPNLYGNDRQCKSYSRFTREIIHY